MKQAMFTVMLGLALTGCSSPSDREPTEAFCTSFGPSATYQWQACNNGCNLVNQASAHDLDLLTNATIQRVDGQITYTTKLTATSVADIPSGAVPGVFVTEPASANFTLMSRTMRTLDGGPGGVQVETLNSGNTEISRAENGTPAAGYLGMRTTQAFDTLEFTVTMHWSGDQAPHYRVFEICSDGGNV